MEEGTEKKLRQIENEYVQRKAAIEKQRQDWVRENKKAGVAGGDDGLTDEQRGALGDALSAAGKQKQKQEADALKELTDKYKTEAEERAAIEKQYDDDILAMRTARAAKEKELAETSTEERKREIREEIDALAGAESEATADKGKALVGFDFEQLKKDPRYAQAFGNLKETTTETLNSLISLFEEFKGKVGESMDPTQVKEFQQTLQGMYDELLGREDPFSQVAQTAAARAAALAEVAALEKKVKAYKKGNGTIANATKQEQKLTDACDTQEKAETALAKAREKLQKADAKYKEALENLYEKVNDLGDAISGLGDTIGGTEGKILGLIGSVLTFVTQTSQGIKAVAATGAQAISTIEKASVILAIISAAIQLMQTLSALYKDANAQYKEYDAKIKKVEDLTESVNKYELAVLKARQEEERWFGATGLQDLQDVYASSQKALEGYMETATAAQAIYQNESGGGWLTNGLKAIASLVGKAVSLPGTLLKKGLEAVGLDMSGWIGQVVDWSATAATGGIEGLIGKGIGALVDNSGNYKEGTTAAMNNLRIETRKKSSGFLGSGIGGKSQKTEDLRTWVKDKYGADLFDENYLVDIELANQVLDDYGDKLVGNTKETLETLIEYREEFDKWQEEIEDYVSEMYSPLADNLTDALFDWLDSGEDVMDSFKEYASDTFQDIAKEMVKTMIYSDLFDEYKERLGDLYQMYSAGDMSLEDLSKSVSSLTGTFMEKTEAMLPTYEAFVESINSGFEKAGVSLTEGTTSQSGKSGAFTTMTQDQGTKLEGMFTSGLQHWSSMDARMETVAERMNTAEGHLAQIAENTGLSATGVTELKEEFKKMVRDGLKVK